MNYRLMYWIPAARPYRPFSFQVSEFQDFYESDSLNDFLCSASGPFSLEFPRLEGFPSLIFTGLSSAITTSDAAPRTSLAWTASVGCCVPRTSLAGTASVGRLRMSYRPTDLRIFASSDQPTFASSHLRTFAPSLVIHPIFSLMMRKSLRIFPLTKPLPLRSRTPTRLTSLLSLTTSQLLWRLFPCPLHMEMGLVSLALYLSMRRPPHVHWLRWWPCTCSLHAYLCISSP